MSKAEEKAWEWASKNKLDPYSMGQAYGEGYHQAEKDVAELFARIIRSNLLMIDKSVQDMFEQLYTNITGEKMYKGFTD